MKKLAEWIMTAVWIVLALLFGWCEKERTPCLYLLPGGFTGWVVIEYEVAGAPALPVENGYRVYRISRAGVLRTSSSPEEGWATDRYVYVDELGRWSEIDNSLEDGKIHGEGIGDSTRDGRTRVFGSFFVGERGDVIEPEPDWGPFVDRAIRDPAGAS